jgi:hypothetical protein
VDDLVLEINAVKKESLSTAPSQEKGLGPTFEKKNIK